MDSRPIGIFDSGIGGLSAVRALRQLLPGESLIYLGDTARMPYGDRSAEEIDRMTGELTDRLLRQNVKALIAACGVNPRSVADPFGKDYGLGEMLYSDPDLSTEWDDLPSVRVGEDGTVTLCRDNGSFDYTGQAEEKLRQSSFDARFRSGSGSEWSDGMSSAKLRRGCVSAWSYAAEDAKDGQPNLLWLLAGKNGELYLALGYQEEASGTDFFAWVFRLTEDQSDS